MTKSMEKALKYMLSNAPDLQGRFYTVFKMPCEYGTVETLANEGYVAFGDKQKTVVYLLDKGKNYKEIQRNENKAFWKDKIVSFVLGFVSGVLVTVVTSLLFEK